MAGDTGAGESESGMAATQRLTISVRVSPCHPLLKAACVDGPCAGGVEPNIKLVFTHAGAGGGMGADSLHQVVPQQLVEAQGLPSPATVAATTPPAEEKEPLRITVDRCGSQERLRWTPQLHQRFCEATAALGGAPFAKVSTVLLPW